MQAAFRLACKTCVATTTTSKNHPFLNFTIGFKGTGEISVAQYFTCDLIGGNY